uniref:Uncharacterized protein n=1 Tax=Picea sitchensis TaxID=3332 RepID=D5AD23_PICSI|nr:unknown [Picea sitchensis]
MLKIGCPSLKMTRKRTITGRQRFFFEKATGEVNQSEQDNEIHCTKNNIYPL